ncbi:MAG: hypothetical protein ABSC00_07855 [Acidimicrobiales bacterium]
MLRALPPHACRSLRVSAAVPYAQISVQLTPISEVSRARPAAVPITSKILAHGHPDGNRS